MLWVRLRMLVGAVTRQETEVSLRSFRPPRRSRKSIFRYINRILLTKRAIPMRVLTVSKKRSQGVQMLVDEYQEKVKHYCSMEIVHVKSNPKNTSDVKAQIEGEDMLIMQNIKPEDLVIMLDERGKDIGSEEMADLVGDAGRTGASRLVFCIGGPYGHGSRLRARADVAIRLSSMVLNHQIALLVLLEQLYRAWTILKGQKYHH